MTPAAIVQRAVEQKLDIIAVTDHNSAENASAVIKAAEGSEVTVLAGMEVTSSEEVHILALFDTAELSERLQEAVYEKLQPGENDPRRFGEQIVVNEENEVIQFNRRLLIGASALSLEAIVKMTHDLGGISIASHIDREVFGLISQLGFIPDNLGLDALEISPRTDWRRAKHDFKAYESFTWISSSDAHCLDDIGKGSTVLYIRDPLFSEIIMAIRRSNGRNAVWHR